MAFFDFLKRAELNKIRELEELLKQYRPITDINQSIKIVEERLNRIIKEKESNISQLELKTGKLLGVVDLETVIQSLK